jgi:Zn-dependent protease with chaperone function
MWQLRELRASAIDPEGRFSLAPRGSDARLVLTRNDLPDAARELEPPPPSGRGRLAIGILLGVTVMGMLVGMAPDLAGRIVPAAWLAPFGDRQLALLEHNARACNGAAGVAAINGLGDRLAKAAEVPGIRVTVLDAPTINAMTLPGNRIVIYRGLLEVVDGDELAAVMAHELGHARHHDSVKRLVRQLSLSLVANAVGAGAVGMPGLVAGAATLSFSRSMEAAADASALETLHRAGLRADGLARFFGDMRKRSAGADAPRWLATHPPTAEREARAEVGSEGVPALSGAELAAIRVMCVGR